MKGNKPLIIHPEGIAPSRNHNSTRSADVPSDDSRKRLGGAVVFVQASTFNASHLGSLWGGGGWGVAVRLRNSTPVSNEVSMSP